MISNKLYKPVYYLSIFVVILTHIWMLTQKLDKMMRYHAYINLVAGLIIASKLI